MPFPASFSPPLRRPAWLARPRPAVVIAAIALGAACAEHTLAPETAAPGARAEIVYTLSAVAGGRAYREESRFDSLSGRYRYSVCQAVETGRACDTLRVVREGDVLPVLAERLFSNPGERAFRAIPNVYRAAGGITPPDPQASRLEIVRNGTRRVLTWESHSQLPPALQDYYCLILAARGELLLCD